MNNPLIDQIEFIFDEVSQVISDPAVLADVKSLLENLAQGNYISAAVDIVKLAEAVIEAI